MMPCMNLGAEKGEKDREITVIGRGSENPRQVFLEQGDRQCPAMLADAGPA